MAAGPRLSSPRGRRALNFCGFFWFVGHGGVVPAEPRRGNRLLTSLLPLWEKVARTQSATDEGFVSVEKYPSPALTSFGILSRKGRGEERAPVPEAGE